MVLLCFVKYQAAASQQSTVNSRQSPVNSHQSAVNRHQSAVSRHQSAVSRHQSAVSSHQSTNQPTNQPFITDREQAILKNYPFTQNYFVVNSAGIIFVYNYE